jgi:hypothetical protein
VNAQAALCGNQDAHNKARDYFCHPFPLTYKYRAPYTPSNNNEVNANNRTFRLSVCRKKQKQYCHGEETDMVKKSNPRLFCLRILGVIASFIAVSCSSVPTTRFIQKGPDFREILPKLSSIGIISDGTIVASSSTEGGEEVHFISIADSRTAESFMLSSAKSYLAQKGFEVTFQHSPFIGGAYPAEKRFEVSRQKGVAAFRSYPPFYTSDAVQKDEPLQKASRTLLRKVFTSIKTGEIAHSVASDFYLSGKDVEKSLKIIAERSKVDAMFIIIGDGVYVPAGQRIAKGLANFMAGFGLAALTAGATGIGVVASPIAIDSPYLNTWIGLIDLRNGEMLWTNRGFIKGDPLDRDFYHEKWAKEIFYHFPERISLTR